MRSPAGLLSSLLVACASSLYAPPAAACGVCIDGDDIAPFAPPYRREPVPSNFRLFVYDPGPDAGPDALAILVEADGGTAPVPTIVEQDDDAVGGFWLRPTTPLAPGTAIVVGRARLEVGDGVDEAPPTTPTVEVTGPLGGLCCTSVNVGVTATASVDDDALPPQVLRIVLTDDTSTRAVQFAYTPGTYVALGTGDCLRTDAAAVAGASGELLVSVVDWAGNESAAVGPLPFTFEQASPATCPASVPPASEGPSCRGVDLVASPATAAVGLVLFAVGRWKRPRRRRPS